MAANDLNSDLVAKVTARGAGDDEAMLSSPEVLTSPADFTQVTWPASTDRYAAAEKAWLSAPMFPTRPRRLWAAAILM